MSVMNKLRGLVADDNAGRNLQALIPHREELDVYVKELHAPSLADRRGSALAKLDFVEGETGTFDRVAAERLYALVRDRRPERVIETGVCNGYGSLHLLLALEQNKGGRLTSVDYPFRADASLEEFRQETYADFGGARIPADKDPGWIVPDELRDRWEVIEGKSQVELPAVLAESDGIDLFIHDSEHSSLCMAMEIDLAWHHLNDGGVLIVDDISWSGAWDEFVVERDPDSHGLLSPDVAFAVKGGGR